jgi:hypothetical protein
MNFAVHFSVLPQVDIDLDSHSDSLGQLAFNTGDEGVERLVDWKHVHYFWPTQPPTERLHIFVKLLVSGEYWWPVCPLCFTNGCRVSSCHVHPRSFLVPLPLGSMDVILSTHSP